MYEQTWTHSKKLYTVCNNPAFTDSSPLSSLNTHSFHKLYTLKVDPMVTTEIQIKHLSGLCSHLYITVYELH